jgi:hypothetical protein
MSFAAAVAAPGIVIRDPERVSKSPWFLRAVGHAKYQVRRI